jgi:hypothetical protein
MAGVAHEVKNRQRDDHHLELLKNKLRARAVAAPRRRVRLRPSDLRWLRPPTSETRRHHLKEIPRLTGANGFLSSAPRRVAPRRGSGIAATS